MSNSANLNTLKPIVWSIAASDCSGHAGIQADLATFHSLNIHGCTVITAITAQNSQGMFNVYTQTAKQLESQLNALRGDIQANAIKIGLVPNSALLTEIKCHLMDSDIPAIFDPVMRSSTQGNMMDEQAIDDVLSLLPHVALFTPNTEEASLLLNQTITDPSDVTKAAEAFHRLGAKGVLIKGGHLDQSDQCLDYLSIHEDEQTWTRSWLVQPRLQTMHARGTGCSLSSAIAAFIAKGERLRDAVVLANAYTHNGLRAGYPVGQGPGPMAHLGMPNNFDAFPLVCDNLSTLSSTGFPDCGDTPLGLYPVVDSVQWLEKLLPLGIDTAQIRIKDCPEAELEQQIIQAIALGKRYDCRLFINDYWQLAIKHQAYGVHLGQEDIDTADLDALRQAGIRLGISTHGDYEWARAASLHPSYLAIGAIFPTNTKDVHIVGIPRLQRWTQLLKENYPLTAIGGINLNNLQDVLSTGIDSVAVVSAITQADDYHNAVHCFQDTLKAAR